MYSNAPTGGTSGLHVTFELNHRTQPDFLGGGMQLQVWNGETFWGVSPGSWNHSLHHSGEVIRWTQRMTSFSPFLVFEVDGGTSSSWGNFGGGGNLRVWSHAPSYDLSGYSVNASVALSGVGFAGNRVSRLVLKEVRYYVGDQLVAQDQTERVVHSQE